jgi:hypothetical protein
MSDYYSESVADLPLFGFVPQACEAAESVGLPVVQGACR